MAFGSKEILRMGVMEEGRNMEGEGIIVRVTVETVVAEPRLSRSGYLPGVAERSTMAITSMNPLSKTSGMDLGDV